jgi:hypothetical protein
MACGGARSDTAAPTRRVATPTLSAGGAYERGVPQPRGGGTLKSAVRLGGWMPQPDEDLSTGTRPPVYVDLSDSTLCPREGIGPGGNSVDEVEDIRSHAGAPALRCLGNRLVAGRYSFMGGSGLPRCSRVGGDCAWHFWCGRPGLWASPAGNGKVVVSPVVGQFEISASDFL